MSDSYYTYYVKGSLSGAIGVMISHPFDTIKTCFQENKKINYNIKSLYRGLSAPLVGVGLEKAVVFGTYQTIMKKFNLDKNKNHHNMFAGLCSGLSASIIVTPFERIKILKQTEQTIKNLKFKTLFTGLSATFTREIPGFGIYFTVFNNTKKYYNNNVFYDFINGGITGIISWIFIYPQDRIKTKIQINKNKNMTLKESVLEIINSETKENNYNKNFNFLSKLGIGQFYKGFHYALLRAVPLHAGAFCAFEYLNNN